ncbi:isoaspartyl peptidase/L-asparaginase [Heterodontus francisci]|uniref:isoaspartyl peptidase/L-asparaginase n=1 Tax=Heterodontus francisci TaxID=7792 RepID=UPI00355BB60B
MKPIIVVHGGAWAIPDEFAEGSIQGVKHAAKESFRLLENGASAVDAVEAAVRILEDDPIFDAGHGAVLNADGDVELDAIIMDGKTLASGAISCAKNISNPVTLARSVMDKVLIPACAQSKELAQCLKMATRVFFIYFQVKGSCDRVHDTVGAVALDVEGNMACATSTGGITNKMAGRVRDTPIIGSGGYADNQVGAVSSTGHGESILKVTLARLILFHMEQGEPPGKAAEKSLQYMQERVHGRGGVIAVSAHGEWTARFTTKRMPWVSIKEDTLYYGLNPRETFSEQMSM